MWKIERNEIRRRQKGRVERYKKKKKKINKNYEKKWKLLKEK